MFSPVHFLRQEPRRVSCYAFFKGWLLLSLPPRCLRFSTRFDTLNINFGTLTLVSLVRVSEHYLTQRPSLLSLTANRFWVGKNAVGKFLCTLHPYFTPLASKIGLYLGIFQQEPAIARLERLFTPTPRSSDHMPVGPVQASISLSGNFTLPRSRSSGFGSYPCDYRLFRLAFASTPR